MHSSILKNSGLYKKVTKIKRKFLFYACVCKAKLSAIFVLVWKKCWINYKTIESISPTYQFDHFEEFLDSTRLSFTKLNLILFKHMSNNCYILASRLQNVPISVYFMLISANKFVWTSRSRGTVRLRWQVNQTWGRLYEQLYELGSQSYWCART